MKKRLQRDRSFLDIAAFAGIGGLMALGAGIGMPAWEWLHHRPASPAFFFFGLWGLIALCGCAASIYTYYTTGDPPEKPPRGGVRNPTLALVRGGAAPRPADDAAEQERRAA